MPLKFSFPNKGAFVLATCYLTQSLAAYFWAIAYSDRAIFYSCWAVTSLGVACVWGFRAASRKYLSIGPTFRMGPGLIFVMAIVPTIIFVLPHSENPKTLHPLAANLGYAVSGLGFLVLILGWFFERRADRVPQPKQHKSV